MNSDATTVLPVMFSCGTPNSRKVQICRLYRQLPAYLHKGDSDLNLSRVGVLQENISGNTVVASDNRYRITMSDTGPTYARQFINCERSRTGAGEENLSAVASGLGNHIINSDAGPTYARQVISSDKPRNNTVELDLSQSLMDILAGIQRLYSNPQLGIDGISNCTNSWINSFGTKQTIQEEKLENLYKTVMALRTSHQGADTMWNSTKNAIQELIISNSEVIQRLDNSETRLDIVESEIKRVESNTKEKVQNIQEWFKDIRVRSVPEVLAEIISTLQEVINDSAPGAAVESICGEVRNIRQTVISAQQVTKSLDSLVNKLNDRIDKTSVI